MSAEDLIPENVSTPTKDKVMNVEQLAMQIHKLTRNVEELKAEIFENFEKMYKTFVLMYIDVEHLKEKLFKFLKEFETVRDDVEKLVKGRKDAKGRSVNFEEKLNRVKLLVTCCDWLLLMYEEVEGLRTSNLADAYKEAVEKYFAFKDLSDCIFDSFPSNEAALKEFPIVSVVDRKANFVAADLIVKMKKKFFENIMWTKDLVQTKLTIKCFMVESPDTWMEIVDSLHKMDRLERLLTQLFDDLMTHFFRPIMDSSYLNWNLSDCSFTLNHNPLQKSKKKPRSLMERIMTFMSLANFVLKNMETPLDGGRTSLIERFGSRGRGKALFEFLIGCLSPDRTGLKPENCKMFNGTVTTLIVDYTKKKFIKEDEASFLLTQLDLLTSEPSLYPTLVSKASKLVQENIRFGVRVGSKMVTDGDEDGDDDDVGGGDDFSPVASSPFRGLYERYEELMPNLLKFKECCVSLSGCRMVDLFYEAMEVKPNQPIIDQTIQNSSSTFMDSTANITTTSFDTSSQLKGDVRSIGPIMKKSSEEEVLRTWRCMRLVAELFIECVPAIHKEDIKEDAMTVALHHNDCMYMSHHLTLLQHHLRPRSGQKTSKKSKPSLPIGLTSYDLQYDLEKLASKSLVSFLLRMQVELVDVLMSSFERKDTKDTKESTKDAYKRQMDALMDVGNKILKLKKAWIGVLQKDVLHKALGVLSSKIIDVAINHFTDLSSKFIPRRQTTGSDDNNNRNNDDRKQLLSFVAACLNRISDKLIAPLFSSTSSPPPPASSSSPPAKADLSKMISNWRKFEEVRFITEPFVTHRMMMERWCVKNERRGGVVTFKTDVVGEILTPPEARAFLSLAFEGEEREESLRLFK